MLLTRKNGRLTTGQLERKTAATLSTCSVTINGESMCMEEVHHGFVIGTYYRVHLGGKQVQFDGHLTTGNPSINGVRGDMNALELLRILYEMQQSAAKPVY